MTAAATPATTTAVSAVCVVGTADLRSALVSVAEHAHRDPKEALHRIRLVFDPAAQNIAVTATDRYTLALAIVSVEEADEWSPGAPIEVVEVLPDDVAKILNIFKIKDKSAELEYRLRLEVRAGHLTVTDCSGLGIPGRAYRAPRLATETTLSIVPALIHRSHSQRLAAIPTAVTVGGDALARFRAASTAYSAPLDIESHGGTSLLIRCGDSFLALVAHRARDEDRQLKVKEHADAWARRLPGIVAACPDDATGPGEPAHVDLDDVAPAATTSGTTAPEIDPEQLLRAAGVVIETQSASAAALRLRMGIDTAASQQLLDQLEARGIVGPVRHGARDVLIAANDLDELLTELRKVLGHDDD